MNIPQPKIPPLVTVILMSAGMWAIAHAVPGWGLPLPSRWIIAVGLALVGVIIAILGVVSFHRARTTVNPLQPDAASTLVVSGIYRLTRNPMYLGMLLLMIGWAYILAHPIAFAIATAYIPLMNRLQIVPEERALAAKFGPAFTAYQSSVRRWL